MSLPDLPITPRLKDLKSLVQDHPVVLLSAQPGAGKSTVVPPGLLPLLPPPQKILLLEPRRLAATACALRIAQILGEEVGKTAGFRVRGETSVGPHTRIEVVTEAILIRMLQEDPGLEPYSLVIFDEFHERSLAADLGLALLQDTLELRPDLRLVIMSATLELETLQAHFPQAPTLLVEGKTFPVSLEYREHPSPLRWEGDFAQWVRDILHRTTGDTLVFLPGTREIRLVQGYLEGAGVGREMILPLSGQMSLQDQRKVLAPTPEGYRKVILATSVAETSLTIPGIRVVVDSGLSRLGRLDRQTGLDQLYTQPVSLSSATQRAGRAGRTAPGQCFRYWPERLVLPPSVPPEILRSDLTSAALESHLWGAKTPQDLRWLDVPPEEPWLAGVEFLTASGCLEEGGRPTPKGRKLASLGLSPRLGALVLRGLELGEGPLACACAAVLQAGPGAPPGTDFRALLDYMNAGEGPWVQAARREFTLIAQKAGLEDQKWAGGGTEGCGKLLLASFPERICRQTQEGVFQSVKGRQLKIDGGMGRVTYLLAVEADAGTIQGRIYRACPLTAEEILEEAKDRFITTEEVFWEGWTPRLLSLRRLGVLEWSRTPLKRPAGQALATLVAERLSREGVDSLPWDSESREFLHRCRLAGLGREAGTWPDFSDQALAAQADWLTPYLSDRGEVLTSDLLIQALGGCLDWNQKTHLDREAPATLTVPSGSRRKVHYQPGVDPWLEVRIQEIFGWEASPKVCGKPVVLHLLSPAQRPLQVTSDLSSFWKNTYPEVRKDMRGRYPRHYWPENPLEAEPTARAKPRGT